MASKRYAVLDANNVVVNHVLIDDPMPKGYWPGYGKTLVPCESVDTRNGGAGLDLVRFNYTPANCPRIGDTVNLITGVITRFVPQVIVDPRTGANVSTSPSVRLARDVEPKSEGAVTQR